MQAQAASNVVALREKGSTSVDLPGEQAADVNRARRPGNSGTVGIVAQIDGNSLRGKLVAYQRITREWRRHLDSDELSVLLYIADRTVGWGYLNFTASAENILNGTAEYAGLGMHRRKYFRVMDRLEKMGLISRRTVKGRRAEITFNPYWNGPAKSTSEDDMLPISKRAREAQNRASSDTHVTESSDTSVTLNTVVGEYGSASSLSRRAPLADARRTALPVPRKRVRTAPGKSDQTAHPEKTEEAKISPAEKNSEKSVQPVAAGSAADRVKATVAKAQTADRTRRSDQAKLALTGGNTGKPRHRQKGQLKATDIEAVWKVALVETYEGAGIGHFAWSIKDKAQINLALKKWAYAEHGTFGDFVDFAVRHWTQIIARKFSWMTQSPPPKTPELGFFLWRLTDFVSLWATRELERFANSGDQRAYDRLVARGMTHEEAIREIARRDAAAAMRDEMAERERKARVREANAQRREEHAERLENLAGKTHELPDGRKVEIMPGTERRRGQVWGHRAVAKVTEAPKPAPEKTPRKAEIETTQEDHQRMLDLQRQMASLQYDPKKQKH